MTVRWDRVLPLATAAIFWILLFLAGSELKNVWS